MKYLVISFGSRVSGRIHAGSDYDFAVLKKGQKGEELTLDDRVDLTEYLSKKLNINEDKIDIVNIASASPLLKMEIARNGKLIEGDESDFIHFKVRAGREYMDTAKFRRIREKVMQEYANK